ncbi:MAG TPA: YCF48-related protein [Pyrinomonadaceae bacterium]|jgi:photosystem II stability/assembly factor-like uncharacterized protein|nr:YCF48-related protein [Pyrinomonadaceae bacterium]
MKEELLILKSHTFILPPSDLLFSEVDLMRMKLAYVQTHRVQACAFLLMTMLAGVALAQAGWVGARRGQAGKDLNAVFFADSKRGWVAGDGGFVSQTEDGGHSWMQQTTGFTEAVNDIYFRSKDEGYLLAGDRIFSTSDGGNHWSEMLRFLAANFGGGLPELYSVRFTSKKKGWVVGSVSKRDQVIDSLLVHTEDAGTSWERQRLPTHSELIHLDFVNDDNGWIVGAGGTILHTSDGGTTWTLQRAGITGALYHVDFRNTRAGWAVGERGTVLRTTDGGLNWSTVNVPVRTTLLSVMFIGEDEGWIAGRGGVILRSSDGGRTWLQQETRTKQNLYALFINKKNGWAVGGDGMVLQYER